MFGECVVAGTLQREGKRWQRLLCGNFRTEGPAGCVAVPRRRDSFTWVCRSSLRTYFIATVHTYCMLNDEEQKGHFWSRALSQSSDDLNPL